MIDGALSFVVQVLQVLHCALSLSLKCFALSKCFLVSKCFPATVLSQVNPLTVLTVFKVFTVLAVKKFLYCLDLIRIYIKN